MQIFADKFYLYLSGFVDFRVLQAHVVSTTMCRPRCSRFVILLESFSEERNSEVVL